MTLLSFRQVGKAYPRAGVVLEGFDLTLSTPEGVRCAEASVNRANVLGEREIVSAGLAYLPGVTPYADETCEKADRLLLEVGYDNTEVDKACELGFNHVSIGVADAQTSSGGAIALQNPRQIRSLIDAAREVMDAALVQGGTSFDSLYVDVAGSSGYFARSLNAYGRAGRPCRRCETPIVRE